MKRTQSDKYRQKTTVRQACRDYVQPTTNLTTAFLWLIKAPSGGNDTPLKCSIFIKQILGFFYFSDGSLYVFLYYILLHTRHHVLLFTLNVDIVLDCEVIPRVTGKRTWGCIQVKVRTPDSNTGELKTYRLLDWPCKRSNYSLNDVERLLEVLGAILL